MNIQALERDLAAKQQAARDLFAKTARLAEEEGRLMTDDERAAIKALVDEANAIKAKVDRAKADAQMLVQIDELASGQTNGLATRPEQSIGRHASRASLGDQWVRSAAMEFIRKNGHRSQSAWRSPSVELMAATLTEDPASGGALVIPDTRPGWMPTITRRLMVADLMASGTTTSNSVEYMVEKVFTNAANSVAEGAAKPESTLTFEARQEPVRKIAHWLPVTEEMLEDVAQIRSYIDARLSLGVQIEEEDQLLNGTSTPPDILGLLNRSGLAADVAVGVAPDTPQDAIFRQMMAIFAGSQLMPDGHVINPTNWAKILLQKTSTGEYLTGGPFQSIQTPTLWGLPVAVTPVIAVNTALVGAFKQASQVFRHGGIRVEASNSHSDFFIKNLVAIRAEERLALAVYRSAAFGKVTGLPVAFDMPEGTRRGTPALPSAPERNEDARRSKSEERR
jgi:HK97 family phage major capsid protein